MQPKSSRNELFTATAQYLINADIIRIIATIFVVGIHVLYPIYARPDFFGGKIWWLTFLLNGLFRISVPLFLMLSGYLLLDKKTDFSKIQQRLIRRILSPLIGFYCILTTYDILISWIEGATYNYSLPLTNLANTTGTHLYFLVGLAWCYLFIPVLQSFFATQNPRVHYFITSVLLINAIVATFIKYILLPQASFFSTFTIGFMWLGYFMFGFLAKKYFGNFNNTKLYIIFIVGYIFTITTGYYQLQQHHLGNNQFYSGFMSYADEFLSIGVVAMALPAFLLLSKMQLPSRIYRNTLLAQVIQQLATLSFGIYLVHTMVIDILHKFAGVSANSPTMPNLYTYLIISIFCTFSISTLISYLIQKIPQTRWLVGM